MCIRDRTGVEGEAQAASDAVSEAAASPDVPVQTHPDSAEVSPIDDGETPAQAESVVDAGTSSEEPSPTDTASDVADAQAQASAATEAAADSSTQAQTDSGSSVAADDAGAVGVAATSATTADLDDNVASDTADTPGEDAQPEQPPVATGPDDLREINGIADSGADLLHELGIDNFDQLAAMDDDYADRLDTYLEFDGRIARHEWRSQAQKLAQRRAPMDATLPPIPEHKATRDSVDELVTLSGSGVVSNSDDAAWRTVEPDDLKVVKGIGPKLEALLHEIGVRTYEQIAAFPNAYIEQLNEFLSFSGRIQRDNWVDQSAELAKTRPSKTSQLPPIPDERPDNATG